MVASIIRSIDNRQASFFPDGVFDNDPLLLRLVMGSRLDKPDARCKNGGDDILDALEQAQAEGWEW